MKIKTLACAVLILTPTLFAQSSETSSVAEQGSAEPPATSSPPVSSTLAAPLSKAKSDDGTMDKHIYGVLPNYRMADGTKPFEPLSARRKMIIGVKDSFDYPAYFLGAFFSGLNQLSNTNPDFGQGLKGYAKRYEIGRAHV